jgi:hypothetical protein
MKTPIRIITIFLSIFVSSCSNTPTLEESIAKIRALNPQAAASFQPDTSQRDTAVRSENIPAPLDYVTYWKMVRDSCPELFRKVPLSPYEAYDKCKSSYMIGWGCEVGMDDYFQLYAKVLRKKSGAEIIPVRKATLDAMKWLNMLASQIAGGGTFFGHSIVRLEGDLEYSLYQYEHGQLNFENIVLDKERKELFKLWRRNIRNSLKVRTTSNQNEIKNAELELLLIGTLKDLEALVKTPFTLTFIREYVHRLYNDFKYPL